MSAQLLQVKYNGAHNAYGGSRNHTSLVTVDNDADIQKEIDLQLNLCDYILVKYKGKMFFCERREGGGYTRKELTYHPLSHIFIPDDVQAIQSVDDSGTQPNANPCLAMVLYRPDYFLVPLMA